MNQRELIAATATSLISLALASGPAMAAEKEKCFGIAKAGQNNCASEFGLHSCAGKTKVDMDKADWKFVPAGTCKELKGLSLEEAKEAVKKG